MEWTRRGGEEEGDQGVGRGRTGGQAEEEVECPEWEGWEGGGDFFGKEEVKASCFAIVLALTLTTS